MIPSDSRRPSEEDASAHTEKALDEALTETFPASDAINLHQWSEMEATERKRAEREARRKSSSNLDRVAAYCRGPTAFSA